MRGRQDCKRQSCRAEGRALRATVLNAAVWQGCLGKAPDCGEGRARTVGTRESQNVKDGAATGPSMARVPVGPEGAGTWSSAQRGFLLQDKRQVT